MAQIELRLLNKVQKETGMSEVRLVLRFSRHDLYALTGIFVKPDYFEYFIDRKKTKNPKRPLPENVFKATKDKAEKNGWALRNNGIIVTSAKALQTPDVKYHNEQAARMEELKAAVIKAYNETPNKDSLTSEWLKIIIEEFNHPGKEAVKETPKTFYELAEDYITKPHGKRTEPLAESHARVYRVLVRVAARYEGFVNATDRTRRTWSWNDLENITKEDVEDFFDYIRHEAEIAEDHPELFKKLLENYPASTKPGRRHDKIEKRGGNTACKMKSRFKAIFNHFYEQGLMKNRPFDGVTIGTAKLGTPVYITIDERNKIAETNLEKVWEGMSKEERKNAIMPLKTIIEQRDIFIFQCFIGCRVGDLLKLTKRNIDNGILTYSPHKTKDAGRDQVQARIPLHEKALALVEKYKGVDEKGRLFPFLTAQRYNDCIKAIFRMTGITRMVEVRNALTGENEFVSIADIASSHLARRTFIGNAYFKVQDPNLIGKMSGHVEGSKAFSRYRKIEDETLRNVIDLIG
ncbi:MAG: phage integrase SAM-like domain-containing protein [Prevotella sp.]|nr:phage integrase SAM-like domain-containing protein [Prevotella sp.]